LVTHSRPLASVRDGIVLTESLTKNLDLSWLKKLLDRSNCKSREVQQTPLLQLVNARTQDKAGKELPVVITYYTDKSFDFVVKTPPVAIQLLEVSKVKSGSAQPNRKKVAEITWDQVKAIAEDKMPDLNCFNVASAMRMVAGTARSMGITVKGTFPENI